MWKRDHAVHIRRQGLSGETAFHQVDSVRRTVTGRDDSDIVPRSYPSIIPHEPTERPRVLLRVRLQRFDLEIVINRPEFQVVLMDVATRWDCNARKPNHFSIPEHGIARLDVAKRNFMTRLYGVGSIEAPVAHLDPLTRR